MGGRLLDSCSSRLSHLLSVAVYGLRWWLVEGTIPSTSRSLDIRSGSQLERGLRDASCGASV